MTKQEILELIKEAKALGLKSLEVDGMKVEFNSNDKTPSQQPATVQEELTAEELVAKPGPLDEYTDEEILFWSSDYGLDLAAAKTKEHMEKLQRKQEDIDKEQL